MNAQIPETKFQQSMEISPIESEASYAQRRIRNNMAVQKSRCKKKQKYEELCDEARDSLEFNKWIRLQLLQFYKEVPMSIPPESALLKQTDAATYIEHTLSKKLQSS